MKFLADLFKSLGNSAASVGTQGCWVLFIDEPKMPKALLDK